MTKTAIKSAHEDAPEPTKSPKNESLAAAMAMTAQKQADDNAKSQDIKREPMQGSTGTIKPAERPARWLPAARLRLDGYLHNKFDVTVERGHELQDVLKSGYWKHVATQFKPHDELVVICEDGSWYARLLVINCDRLWAKVYKMEYHDLTKAVDDVPAPQEDDFEVTWTTLGKFTIYKKGNEGLPALKDGFQTKIEALQWLDGYLKSLNA